MSPQLVHVHGGRINHHRNPDLPGRTLCGAFVGATVHAPPASERPTCVRCQTITETTP